MSFMDSINNLVDQKIIQQIRRKEKKKDILNSVKLPEKMMTELKENTDSLATIYQNYSLMSP